MSDSATPGLQHIRLPCLSLSPGVTVIKTETDFWCRLYLKGVWRSGKTMSFGIRHWHPSSTSYLNVLSWTNYLTALSFFSLHYMESIILTFCRIAMIALYIKCLTLCLAQGSINGKYYYHQQQSWLLLPGLLAIPSCNII